MIELMKFDMGGSACTLGAAKVVNELPIVGAVPLYYLYCAFLWGHPSIVR